MKTIHLTLLFITLCSISYSQTKIYYDENLLKIESLESSTFFEIDEVLFESKTKNKFSGIINKAELMFHIDNGQVQRIENYQSTTYDLMQGELVFGKEFYEKKWFDDLGRLIIKCSFKSRDLLPYQSIFKYDHRNFGSQNDYERFIRYFEPTKVKTYEPNTNRELLCEFNDHRPVKGEFFYRNTLSKYENGTIIQESFYKNNTKELELIEILNYKAAFYYDKIITKKTTFYQGEMYELNYLDGKKNTGSIYEFNEISTYENGTIHGPYALFSYENNRLTETGSKWYGNKHGEIVFYSEEGEQTGCIYNFGEPIEGTVFEGKTEFNYLKGKFHGVNIYDNSNHAVTYSQGLREGLETFIKGDSIFSGVNKNNEHYSGDFINSRTMNVEHYSNGKKDGVFIQYYEDVYCVIDKIVEGTQIWQKTTSLDRDSILAEIVFKNGRPFSGKLASIEDRVFLILTPFVKGSVHGDKVKYKRNNGELIEVGKSTYSKGKVNGYYTDQLYFWSDYYIDISGVFKNGKPDEGEFLTINESRVLKVVSNFKNGVKNGGESYYGRYLRLSIKVLEYIDGTPVSGEYLEYCEKTSSIAHKNYYVHKLKNKVRVETQIDTRTILYEKNKLLLSFYDSYGIDGLEWQIDYTDNTKQIGSIMFYLKQKELGKFSFNKGEIIDGYLENTTESNKIIQTIENNKLLTRIYPLHTHAIYTETEDSNVFENKVIDYTCFQSFYYNQLICGNGSYSKKVVFNGEVVATMNVNNGYHNGFSVDLMFSDDGYCSITLYKDDHVITRVQKVKFEDIAITIKKIQAY